MPMTCTGMLRSPEDAKTMASRRGITAIAPSTRWAAANRAASSSRLWSGVGSARYSESCTCTWPVESRAMSSIILPKTPYVTDCITTAKKTAKKAEPAVMTVRRLFRHRLRHASVHQRAFIRGLAFAKP